MTLLGLGAFGNTVMLMTETTKTFVTQLLEATERHKQIEQNPEERAKLITELAEQRIKRRDEAAEHFVDHFFRSDVARAAFEANVLERVPNKTLRVHRWTGRGESFKDQHLSNLLDIGDLVTRFQDYLDETYQVKEDTEATPGFRFRVFNHRISGARATALVVSWDPTGFEKVDDILLANRQSAQDRESRRREGPRGGDDEEQQDQQQDQGPRRNFDGPSRGRGRGPRGPRRDFDRSDNGPRRDFDRRDNGGGRGPRRDFDNGPRRDFDRRDGGGGRGGPRRNFDGPRRNFDNGPRRNFDNGGGRGPREGSQDARQHQRQEQEQGPPQQTVEEYETQSQSKLGRPRRRQALE